MKGLFSKLEIKSQNILSKQEKKKLNSILNNKLDIKAEYKAYNLSNKFKIIVDNKNAIYFEYYGKIYPTIHNFDTNCYKKVVLDSGAIEPLKRGADVMCPGVLKYLDLCDKFEKDEIVGIEILNYGIIGIGETLMSYEEMIKQREGPIINVMQIEGDSISTNDFL